MSQSDFGVIDPNTKSGTQLAVDLNGFRDAVNSGHSGATRPAYLPAGGHWVRVVSSTRWDLVFYDGSVDYTLRSVNPTTGQGTLSLPSGTTANRPASPAQFDSRGNSTTGAPEWWSGSAWVPFSGTDTLRIDVASATTVDLTSLAPNTRHINITGTTTITGFTIAAGQCYFVRFNATLTLTNGAELVTQAGANITTAAGDTCILRATAANVVEVLVYTPLAYPFVREYVSAEQVITAGGALTLTHGLGVVPKMSELTLVCKIAELGYSVGNVVVVGFSGMDSVGSNYGPTRVYTPTHIVMCQGANFQSILINDTVGIVRSITNAHWRLIVRAWA